jgi:hypothetical protein
MKSRTLTCLTAMTVFTVLAFPLRLVPQEQQQPKKGHHRYKLVDLGTFGGPDSYVGALGGVSQVLSDQGTVAGCADTSTPDPNCPNSLISSADPQLLRIHTTAPILFRPRILSLKDSL